MRARVTSETVPPPFSTLLVVWKLTPARAATSLTETCLAGLRDATVELLCAGSERSPRDIGWRPDGTQIRVSAAQVPAARLDQPERGVGVRRGRAPGLRPPHQRALLPRIETLRDCCPAPRHGLVQAALRRAGGRPRSVAPRRGRL